jgi:hypothetical protein
MMTLALNRHCGLAAPARLCHSSHGCTKAYLEIELKHGVQRRRLRPSKILDFNFQTGCDLAML